MQKELLKKENIREDLLKVIEERKDIHWEWRLCYIAPLISLALLICLVWCQPWLGLLVFLPAVYHIVRLILALREIRARKKEILTQLDRGDLTISEEVLSHIAEENVHEPHRGFRHAHSTKMVHTYYFRSGASWRKCATEKHYAWSKLYNLSPAGLENTSVAGNTFYYVRLQSDGDIGYIYNKKMFVYKEG